MALGHVNVLLSSFPGLSLPPTLSVSLPSTSTVADLTERIAFYFPDSLRRAAIRVTLTTTSNKHLLPCSSEQLSSLVSTQDGLLQTSGSSLLPLRLTVPLRGGKGGFGSQLRAAGGRMSSKRKGNQGENSGSNRNLDGRRLRTINEAKALAEYLAVKPEMDRKEKEERRGRWEAVVELAERRQEELKHGGGKSKLDGQWMEDREEMGEKAREAVLAAMKDDTWNDNLRDAVLGGSSSSASEGSSGRESTSASESGENDVSATLASTSKPGVSRRYIGFDDDDEFMSENEEACDDEPDETEGKGKGRA